MPQRSPEQIRASIEANRMELERSIGTLRSELVEAANWRKHLERHKKQVMIGAAVTGFVIGGGIAGVTGLFRRR
jgi:heterodisulfide reductase subunit A-like polyferredoxin